MNKKVIIVLSLLFLSSADSMLIGMRIKNTRGEKNRQHPTSTLDQKYQMIQETKNKAIKEKNFDIVIKSLYKLVEIGYAKEYFKETVKYGKQILTLLEELKHWHSLSIKQQVNLYIILGRTLRRQANEDIEKYKQAIKYLKKAFKLKKKNKLNNNEEYIIIKDEIANNYLFLSNIPSNLNKDEHKKKAIKYYEKNSNPKKTLTTKKETSIIKKEDIATINSLLNLGNIYKSDLLHQKAIIYYDKALNIINHFKVATLEYHTYLHKIESLAAINAKELQNAIKKMKSLTTPNKICFFCAKPLSKSLSCSACKKVFYCNCACQEKNWGRHKHICQLIK